MFLFFFLFPVSGRSSAVIDGLQYEESSSGPLCKRANPSPYISGREEKVIYIKVMGDELGPLLGQNKNNKKKKGR